MNSEYTPPFRTVFSALAYYVYNNPARAKSLNLLEPENSPKERKEQFSGGHPSDLWASVCCAVRDVLSTQEDAFRCAFGLYYLTPGREWCKCDIAYHLNLPLDAVRRRLGQIIDDLEREMLYRKLIDPDFAEVYMRSAISSSVN